MSLSLTQYLVALKFATESGLLLKLGQHQDKDDVMLFQCELFSCFAEERETLFFGGDTVLKINGIMQNTNGKWMAYDMFLEPINAFSRMINGLSVKEQSILMKKSSQKAMKMIFVDVLRTLVWQQHESMTPKYVRDTVLFHHSNASRVRLLYRELMTEYQWLHCILKSNSNGTLDTLNIAVLFCHSDDITLMMPKDMDLSETESISLINDMYSLSRMALDVKIRLLWPSAMPKTTKNRLNNASIALYGSGCECQFDSKSVSFTATDSNFSAEAQGMFQNSIEKMIERLSFVPTPAAPKKMQLTGHVMRQLATKQIISGLV